MKNLKGKRRDKNGTIPIAKCTPTGQVVGNEVYISKKKKKKNSQQKRD